MSGTGYHKLCMYCLFSFHFQILASPVARQQHGYEAIMLLTLLVNYRKYEVRYVLCMKSLYQVN
jgi:hypothetical protein